MKDFTYLLTVLTILSHVDNLLHCRVSTWTGDRLCAGKPSRFVIGHLNQLSLVSIWGT